MSSLFNYHSPLPKILNQPKILALQMRKDAFLTLASYLIGKAQSFSNIKHAWQSDDYLIPQTRLTQGGLAVYIFSDRSAFITYNDTLLPLPLRLPAKIENKNLTWYKNTMEWSDGKKRKAPVDFTQEIMQAARYWLDMNLPLIQWEPNTPREQGLIEKTIFPWTRVPLSITGQKTLMTAAKIAGAYINQYKPITHGYSIKAPYLDWNTMVKTEEVEWESLVIWRVWETITHPADTFVHEYQYENGKILGHGNTLYISPGHMRFSGTAHQRLNLIKQAAGIDLPEPV